MGKKIWFILHLLLPLAGFSQTDTLINRGDSLNGAANRSGEQVKKISPKVYPENSKVTFNSYFSLLGCDVKQSFAKPLHMTKMDWSNLGKFALVSGALSFADEPIQKGALNLRNSNPNLDKTGKHISDFGGINEVYTLAALGGYSFVFKNEKLKTTTLLATQSYITSAAIETVIKLLSGRTRPSDYPSNTEAEPGFYGPFSKTSIVRGKKEYNSFPSGHTTVAFAVASVFALEYRDQPIVPIIAYSAATLIGISRIIENQHWSTDVLAGAALGFLTGREVVSNYNRYIKIKAAGQKRNTLVFNLGYSFKQLTPGVTYNFK